MSFRNKIISFLDNKKVFYCLWSLLLLQVIVLFFITHKGLSRDHDTYMFYVKGLELGRYSYWYFLKEYIPDTFRNPGYPFFLYALSFINDSLLVVQVTQLLLYIVALFIMLRIIDFYDKQILLKSIFTILLMLNFIVSSYTTYIYPEALMIFLITLILYIELYHDYTKWKNTFLLVLLYAFCFQIRPVILFIPFLRFAYYLYKYKKSYLLKNMVFLFLFIASLLPYGFWNLKHHHAFKITPLEGGGGVMHLGYWSPKMINYVEGRYWQNIMYDEHFISFDDDKNIPENIRLFNQEWDSIDRVCAKYLTAKDTLIISEMKKYPDLFETYNSAYTIEREKILKKLAVKHYLSDLKYTFKLKAYSFFRLWFNGLVMNKHSAGNIDYGFIPVLITFSTTFFTFILFLIHFIYCLFKKRNVIMQLILPLLLCLYFDVLHLPFAIQSRYTIPVRMLYIFSLSFMLYKIYFEEQKSDSVTKD